MSKNYKIFIPNGITSLRIILSGCLLLINPDNISFLLIYGLCGLTDVADGYVARRWNVSSKIGALLDSMADFMFIVVLFVIFIPRLDWKEWMVWWIVSIAVIRSLSILIGAVKYHSITFIHTYGNKVTGLLLFCFPLLFRVFGMTVTVLMIGTAASISAVEELMIIVHSNTLNRDRKGWRDNGQTNDNKWTKYIQ